MLIRPADGEKHPEEALGYEVSIRSQNHIFPQEQVLVYYFRKDKDLL
jgi:hypothetical protein